MSENAGDWDDDDNGVAPGAGRVPQPRAVAVPLIVQLHIRADDILAVHHTDDMCSHPSVAVQRAAGSACSINSNSATKCL